MVDGTELVEWMSNQGWSVTTGTDAARGLGAWLIRARADDCLMAGVSGDLSINRHVNALLDLLAWHNYEVVHGQTPPRKVRLLIGHGPRTETAFAPLRTLKNCHTGSPSIEFVTLSHSGGALIQSEPDSQPAPTFQGQLAERWAGYLQQWHQAEPSGAAQAIVEAIPDRLRLYPQLSKPVTNAEWSLRLDGIQVGLVKASGGMLSVGSEGSDHMASDAWHGVNDGEPFFFNADEVGSAVDKVQLLIESLEGVEGRLLSHGEPEHALESSIVRGTTTVTIGGQALRPIGVTDSMVARGSQIPTLWASGTRPRYLDALLREGPIPWAVEMKVNAGGGYGAYFRHAIGQAVLYRHYLRTTSALQTWFGDLGLDQSATRAAVVYPRPKPTVEAAIARRISNLLLTAAAFDVQVAMVDLPRGADASSGT